MGFNLLNNKSKKQFVYSIFSDKMRFREFCRQPIVVVVVAVAVAVAVAVVVVADCVIFFFDLIKEDVWGLRRLFWIQTNKLVIIFDVQQLKVYCFSLREF